MADPSSETNNKFVNVATNILGSFFIAIFQKFGIAFFSLIFILLFVLTGIGLLAYYRLYTKIVAVFAILSLLLGGSPNWRQHLPLLVWFAIVVLSLIGFIELVLAVVGFIGVAILASIATFLCLVCLIVLFIITTKDYST